MSTTFCLFSLSIPFSQVLDLHYNALTRLPAGVFDGLALRYVDLNHNHLQSDMLAPEILLALRAAEFHMLYRPRAL